MKKLYKEPLVHFLVLALGLFVLHSAVSHEDANADAKRIVVDQNSLLKFIQFRTKSFEVSTAKRQLESFSEVELKRLIDDYVREEALYREAQALGLARDDYVIKRRLIQKVDYIARGFAESFDKVTEDDIRDYFEKNQDDYYINPRITFTHVFYSNQSHGAAQAEKLAGRKLAELNGSGVSFYDAGKHGERFLYNLNYVERSKLFVGGQFGEAFASNVFALKPDEQTWRGPILSDHGAHLVLVKAKQAGYMPTLNEVYLRVAQEAQRAIVADRAKQATQQIVDSYDIDIVYEKPEEQVASLHQKADQ
jgi:hypothetical protein